MALKWPIFTCSTCKAGILQDVLPAHAIAAWYWFAKNQVESGDINHTHELGCQHVSVATI
jgi:hypothetical protein